MKSQSTVPADLSARTFVRETRRHWLALAPPHRPEITSLTNKPPRAVRAAKRPMRNACQALMHQSKDHHEAFAALSEKRNPLRSGSLTRIVQMTSTNKMNIERLVRIWNSRSVGLIAEMGLKIEKISAEGVLVRMPFNPAFCADRDESLLHGGVLTALLDSVFGLANFVAVEGVSTMATLDLRVDYLRPAKSRADVLVEAQCYRQTRHVAFNTGIVRFDETDRAEIARGTASFAITRGGVHLLDNRPTEGKQT